jgi:hypothetical protein
MVSVIIAFTTGCDKKNNSNGDVVKTLLPAEFRVSGKDDGTFYEYLVIKLSYDNDNRIIKSEWFWEDELDDQYDLSYNEEGKLSSIAYKNFGFEEIKDFVVSFTYSGNFVTFTEDGEVISTLELQNDRVINVYKGDGNDEEALINSFSYDSKGNAIEVYSKGEEYDDFTQCDLSYEDIATINYADKNGIFKSVETSHWFLMMGIIVGGLDYNIVNNPVLVTEQGEGMLCGELYKYTNTFSYSYEKYNNDYPEIIIETVTEVNLPAKKSTILPVHSFNKNTKHRKSISSDEIYKNEIKYIEAK